MVKVTIGGQGRVPAASITPTWWITVLQQWSKPRADGISLEFQKLVFRVLLISCQFHCHCKCIILAFWLTDMNLGVLIRILLWVSSRNQLKLDYAEAVMVIFRVFLHLVWLTCCNQAGPYRAFLRQAFPSFLRFEVKWSVKSLSRVRLCNPVDCSLLGSFVHGIL